MEGPVRNLDETLESLQREIAILRRALEMALPGYLEAAGEELGLKIRKESDPASRLPRG